MLQYDFVYHPYLCYDISLSFASWDMGKSDSNKTACFVHPGNVNSQLQSRVQIGDLFYTLLQMNNAVCEIQSSKELLLTICC